uniref:SPK domain-containing protein n=1 Tax=Caenorhabditis tropicalis TaxID=1561998 RepID=A0A1I7TS00_9PELO
MQTVADRIAEPFNSEDLKEWFPLIKSLLTSEQHTLRDCGAQFWKKSFGTVKAQLIYPDDLRTILLGMAEEHCIHIPPESRLDSTSENQDLIPPLEDRPNENVQEISPPDTQFNPFDRQVTDLQLVRNEERTQLISVDQFSRNLINLEGNLDAIRIYLNDQYRGIMMPQLMLNRFLVRHRATVRNGRLIITSVVFLELEGIRFRFLFEVNWSFHVEIFQILILSFVHFLRFE